VSGNSTYRDPAPLPPRPAAPPSPDLLLVEESPLEVELTLRALQEHYPTSYIEVARDGEEALDFLFGRGAHRERGGALPPRLILLGLKLPRVDGIEVLRAVRTNSRTSMVPVVVLTSSDDPRELAQCYQLGANSCVQKPVPYDELRTALQGVGRYWLELNQKPPAPGIPMI
jgi:two-component system response regulator